jgi:hypothetical protein
MNEDVIIKEDKITRLYGDLLNKMVDEMKR